MTDTQQQIETVYIITNSAPDHAGNPVLYVREQLGTFETSLYRRALAERGLAAVARSDWDNMWSAGDNVFSTREAAQAELDDPFGPSGRIIELSLDDVTTALAREFGPADDQHTQLIELLGHPMLTAECESQDLYYCRVLGRDEDYLLIEADNGVVVASSLLQGVTFEVDDPALVSIVRKRLEIDDKGADQ